jgi:mono/diheme cytochrome c family protein
MKSAALILAALTVAAVAALRSGPSDPLPSTTSNATVADFTALYGMNCAGCHGADGRGSVARGLADPIFLQIASDATIRRVAAAGVPGTAMPAFAKDSGGTLTDKQIDAIVGGLRARWTVADVSNVNPPPYSMSTDGDPRRGANVFAMFCSRCHGADGRGGTGGSSIVDPSYLSLVSNQGLRTTVIVGRPDLGAPDWRGNVPGKPMSSDEVSDVVAWLAANRPQ